MPSRSSITPSPGTMTRRAATISDRRARMAGSSGGICMPRSLRQMKKRRKPSLPPLFEFRDLKSGSALAGLEARVGLVDDVDAALAAHDAAVLVAQLHGLEGMADLHGSSQQKPRRRRGNSERARKIGTREGRVNPGAG